MAIGIDDKNIKKAAQPSPVTQPRRTGTGFTNVQRILGANVGNRLGQTIGQGVGQVAQQSRQALGQTQQQFQQKAQQGLVATEQAKQRAQDVVGAQDVDVAVQKAQQDPNLFKDFAQYRAGTYSGPRSFQDVTDEARLMGQAREAEQLGKAATTQGGRSQLLQRFVGSPDYSRGERTLDALLLGRENLSGVRRGTAGLTAEAQRQADAAQATAQNIEAQNRAFAQQVQQGLGGIQSKFLTGLEQKKASILQEQQNLAKYLTESLGKYAEDIELTEDQARRLGLSEGQRIGRLNPNDLDIINPLDASLQDIANQEDLTKYQALQSLAGQNLTALRSDDTLGNLTKKIEEGQKVDPKILQRALDLAHERANQAVDLSGVGGQLNWMIPTVDAFKGQMENVKQAVLANPETKRALNISDSDFQPGGRYSSTNPNATEQLLRDVAYWGPQRGVSDQFHIPGVWQGNYGDILNEIQRYTDLRDTRDRYLEQQKQLETQEGLHRKVKIKK